MAKKNTKGKDTAEKDLNKALKSTLKSSLANNPLLKLKNFEEIKKDYEFTDETFVTGAVMHKMSEVIEFYLKLIQQILQPEEFHALYECTAFNDADKVKLFDLYKRLIVDHRELLKAVVMNDEKNTLSAIQFIHEEIKSAKPQILDTLSKMQSSWKKGGSVDSHKGTKQYFG